MNLEITEKKNYNAAWQIPSKWFSSLVTQYSRPRLRDAQGNGEMYAAVKLTTRQQLIHLPGGGEIQDNWWAQSAGP